MTNDMDQAEETAEAQAEEAEDVDETSDNPLLTDSDLPYGMPAFDKIESAHFLPPSELAMPENLDEIEAIAGSEDEPTFENTIMALEKAGRQLTSIASLLSHRSGPPVGV